ncbi:MAG: RNA-binding protein [Mycobacteriaceae bacterium]|nr:RNA-binding protein [Mycobacteriaceae bacterium]
MSEWRWPDLDAYPARVVRGAWPDTVRALPIGTSVAGVVIGRQPFGVFLRLDDLPAVLGLAETVALPRGLRLPRLGARVTGRVLSHEERNCQVKIALT